MLQSLATFGAGVFTGQSLQTCHAALPQCSLSEDRARLLLRCHGAHVPQLPGPGVLSRQRPQLSVRLGAIEKQTGPGDYADSDRLYETKGSDHSEPVECNWRFGDVLTFLVTADDVLQGGLRFSLLSRTDFRFGPLQMELAQTVELGAGALDLRDALKALPHGPPQGKTRFRESPVLQIALLQMQSGCPLDVAATAYVSLTYFGDPSRLLQEAAKAERPLLKRIADPCLDPCRHCADSDAAQQHALPRTSFAEPDSEQPPDSDYNTCEVPSYLYNSWSPEARCPSESPSGCRVSPDPWTPQQSAPRSGHFAWPGAPRSRDAEALCTTGLRGVADVGKQGVQRRDGPLGPSTSLPQPLVVKLRLQQPVPSSQVESAEGLPT
ncbi:ilvE [Symbiodinium natans]|uniref:IlvE protein n=1 Tax=Symbiodinium natans TaxID=878477 RepID=A0A812JYY5_9DINO|nr:ilvE [Symbiodinium natans]